MSAGVEDVPLVDNIKSSSSSIEPTPSDDATIHEKEKDATLTDEVIKKNDEEENSTTLVCDQKEEEVLDIDDKEPKNEVDTDTTEENKNSTKRGLEDEIPLPLTKTSSTMSVI